MTDKKNFAPLIASVMLLALASSSRLSPKGDTIEEKRIYAEEMRDKALAALYEENPKLEHEVEASVGYAVFSNFSAHPGLLSFAAGYGVLKNKETGKDTHLKWHRLTIGPGIAVKGLYALVVFQDPELLKKVEEGRWMSGGQMEASFVFGDFGGALEHGWVFKKGMDAYYVTHTGVALELELIGIGKVSNNAKLNRPPSP